MPRQAERSRYIVALVFAAGLTARFASAQEHAANTTGVMPPTPFSFAAAVVGAAQAAAESSNSGPSGSSAVGVKPFASGLSFRGYVQAELARTISNPEHWSKMRLRTELSARRTYPGIRRPGPFM